MLAMKKHCGACRHSLLAEGVAYICSYECTWCERCSDQFSYQCPNCQGVLVKRPARKNSPRQVIWARIKNKFFA